MTTDMKEEIEKEIETFIEHRRTDLRRLTGEHWREAGRNFYFNNWDYKLPGLRPEGNVGRITRNFYDDVDAALIRSGLDLKDFKGRVEEYLEVRAQSAKYFEMTVVPEREKENAKKANENYERARKDLFDLVFPAFILLREKGYSKHRLTG